MQLDGETVRKRTHRFNREGVEALKDQPRSGRPPTYTPEQTATVIATALTKPQTLGLPFTTWTLDRLAAYLHGHKGIAILCGLRRIGLAHTRFAAATCGTIRLKLLKIGALVRVSVRRITVAMASACPYRQEYATAHARLRCAAA